MSINQTQTRIKAKKKKEYLDINSVKEIKYLE